MAEPQPMRVFVGIKMAADIAEELARLARPLARYHVRLVPPEDIHLTLVPPWQETRISDAIRTLEQAIAGIGRFLLTFTHVSYGPQPRRPRLLWAECAASEEITLLHTALLDAFGRSETRPFRPHVTLARIRGNGAAIARKYPIDQDLSLAQHLDTIELFQSPPPGERGYRVLAASALARTHGAFDQVVPAAPI
jgi:2'-5' RNA ligase